MTGFKSKKAMANDMNVQQSPPEDDWGLQRVNNWKLERPILPKRCFLTGNKLWFKSAYHGIRVITGPGEPIYDHYWIDKEEFLLWHLRR